MPELPEAENICRALDRNLKNEVISKVEVFTPKMRTPLEPLLTAGLVGKRVTECVRRARYVVCRLDDNRALVMHFGMSGVVRVEDSSVPKRKHEHVFIHFDSGKIFRFECTRRFSMLEVHELDDNGFPAFLNALGVEPLEDDFTAEYMLHKAAGKRGAVKPFIMDNDIVVGIGNIYVTETLFKAKVRPDRPAMDVTLEEWQEIVDFSKKILARAIELGGSSISDFLNVDGSEGKFAQELCIYGKEKCPCPHCGRSIEAKKLGGRTSAYCPECQK
jgi:formamidopyrimidine-DNA glycosylase